MKWFKLLLSLSLLVLPLYGCAFGTDYVKINKYSPETSSDTGGGAEIYLTKVEDNRSEPQYLGQKAGGYIALEKDLNLSNILTSSVANCLDSAGYKVVYSDNPPAGSKVMHASIEELWTTFVQGFWTVDANAKAKMEFELKVAGTDRTLWSKKIGKGATNSAVAAPPGLFEDALNDAMSQVMKSFQSEVSSEDFKKELMDGTAVPVPTPAEQAPPAEEQPPAAQ